MTKIAGFGSISQRHGSTDPDPDLHQNVMSYTFEDSVHLLNNDFITAPYLHSIERIKIILIFAPG
jgi:hypothetical protein